MERVRNTILFAVASIMICGITVCFALHESGVEFPRELWPEDSYLFLDGRHPVSAPNLSYESVMNSSFQNGFEQWLGDKAPCREFMLESVACYQRLSIRPMAELLGYRCYPASFGSDIVIDSVSQIVLPQTNGPNDYHTTAAHGFTNMVNESASKHPSVTFVFEQIGDVWSSEFNPSYALTTSRFDKTWAQQNVLSRLNPSIITIFDPIESEEELATQWFSTEHHQTLQRALVSYNKIAEALGLSYVDYANEQKIINKWYGSSARLGRFFDYSSDLYDLPTDFSNLTVRINGERVERGERGAQLNEQRSFDENKRVYNFYHVYYGATNAEVVYENSGSNNGRTCLFVEQSYGVCIEPYIANNYQTTICIDPSNHLVKKSIDEYIEEYGVDDVIIQCGVVSYRSIANTSPDYCK